MTSLPSVQSLIDFLSTPLSKSIDFQFFIKPTFVKVFVVNLSSDISSKSNNYCSINLISSLCSFLARIPLCLGLDSNNITDVIGFCCPGLQLAGRVRWTLCSNCLRRRICRFLIYEINVMRPSYVRSIFACYCILGQYRNLGSQNFTVKYDSSLR